MTCAMIYSRAEVLGVLWLDVVRVLCVVLTGIAMWGVALPLVLRTPAGSWRVWLLLIAIEGWGMRGALSAVANIGGTRMPMWSTPFSLAASAVGVAYVVVYRRDVERGRALAVRLNRRV